MAGATPMPTAEETAMVFRQWKHQWSFYWAILGGWGGHRGIEPGCRVSGQVSSLCKDSVWYQISFDTVFIFFFFAKRMVSELIRDGTIPGHDKF